MGSEGWMEARGQAWLPSGALPVSTVLSSLGRLQHQPGAASWAEGWGKEKSLSQNGFPMTCFPPFAPIQLETASKGAFLMRALGCRPLSTHGSSVSPGENLDRKLQQTHTMQKSKVLQQGHSWLLPFFLSPVMPPKQCITFQR